MEPNVTAGNGSVDIERVRQGVAALAALMGVLMIVGFFAFMWADAGGVKFIGIRVSTQFSEEEKEVNKVTAYELWRGHSGTEEFSLDFDTIDRDPTGFDDVRFLDRFLILMPLGGLVLVGFAARYTLSPIGSANGQSAALAMVITAALLLAFPFVWQALSDRDIEDNLETYMMGEEGLGPDDMAELRAFYGDKDLIDASGMNSTGEQQLFAGIAFLAALGAVAVDYTLKPSPPVSHQNDHYRRTL